MATKLKNMKLTSVDLVRAGANQEADICLFKSADAPEAQDSPSETERNIFKRFLSWIRENPTEAESEPHSHIEKTEDEPDLEYLYKSALAESLHSIMQDDTLTEIEKKDMAEESLLQYSEKIRELNDEDDDTMEEEVQEEMVEEDDDVDDVDDDDRFDELEEIRVHKFNQNHGRDVRFTTSGGAAGGGGKWQVAGSSSGKIGRNAMLDEPKEKITYIQTGGGASKKPSSLSNPYEGMKFTSPGIERDRNAPKIRDGGKYNTPYHKQARSLAATAGSKKLSGEISAKKVSAAIERGGAVKDFAGKSYMISPQTKGTITCYTGSRGKNGSFKPEKYIQGIKTLQDAQMWGVGTILNDAN